MATNNAAATAPPATSWQTISPTELFGLVNQGMLPFIQGLGQVISANQAAGTVTTTQGTYTVPGSVAVQSEQFSQEVELGQTASFDLTLELFSGTDNTFSLEVVNLPQDLAHGIDAQLDRAIQEVLQLHAEDPPLKPDFGPVQPRGREAYKKETSRWGPTR